MKAIKIVILFMLLVLITSELSAARGQSNTSPPDNSANAGESEKSSVRFSVESDTRFGVFTYVPDQWGELHLRLENSAETPVDLLSSSYFEQQSTLQFGRQFWLPAQSRLSIAHPVFLPKVEDLKNHVANVHSLLIEKSSGNEVLLKSDSGLLVHDRSLLVSSTNRISAVVAGWNTADTVPEEIRDLMIAGRVSQGLNNSLTVLTGQFLPAEETGLNYLDHIVLAENRLADDNAALTALRRWLHAGGRLWIMLDRTDPVLLERLLGDKFQGHVVDRVGLTTVRIDEAPSLLAPDGKLGESVDFENPVGMARVVISGMQVRNTVDGWPAALTRSYGEGRVLITTLGARGWYKPTPPSAERKIEDLPEDERAAEAERRINFTTDFIPVSPMEDLAAYAFGKRDPKPFSQDELESLTQEFVSYQIPPWTLIIGMMSGFLGLLAMLGIWLWRTERSEHFGWIGSVLAVAFGIAFIGIGLSYRYGIPDSIASVQLAQAMDGADDVRTEGMIAVYRREGSTAKIETKNGGTLWPDLTGVAGSSCRMVTTDLDEFHWEGLPQPPGLRTYPGAASRSFAHRIAAGAMLNSDGIVGKLSGTSAGLDNAILATRHGRMGMTLQDDGTFTAKAEDVLGTDQYLDAAFIGDVQDRRRRILKQLFENQNWKDSLVQPQLMVWQNDWDPGFQFGDGLQQQGETLMTVPIQMSRAPVGTEVVIPSPLIGYSTCLAPDGSLPTGFWDDNRREWQERSSPATTWLSCQIPHGVLPLKSKKLRVNVKVTGAMGTLEILGVKDGKEVALKNVKNPVGSLQFEIDDPAVINVSMTGEILLGVKAGMASDGTSPAQVQVITDGTTSYWRIESLSLQLWAVTTELSAEE